MTSVRVMQAEDTINGFIQWIDSLRSLPEMNIEDLDGTVVLLGVLKTLYLAQVQVEEAMRAFGVGGES